MLRSSLQSIGLNLLLLCCVPLFFWGGPGYFSARSYLAFWDLGHIGYFCLFTLWLQGVLLRRWPQLPSRQRFALIFLLVLVVGSSVEGLQMLVVGRDPDVFDVLRDLLGSLVAFALQGDGFGRWPGLFRLYRLLVMGLVGLAIWPLTRAVIDERLAAEQFPVLSDFETPFEVDRWLYARQFSEETAIVRHGRRAVRVQLSTNRYSGVSLFHFPHDWRGYRTLHCSVFFPGPGELVLHTRIHDLHHKTRMREFTDRFNQSFVLGRGWNDLEISLEDVQAAPRGREMDMEHIEGFGLFVVRQDHPQEIYLDYVYLSK